jgi:hypothetical protein
VFNNSFNYVGGGFFLDYQDYKSCGGSRYIPGETSFAAYQAGSRAGADCLWNTQPLTNRTTGFNSRSKTSTYQTVRKTWEAKTDGTYFASNLLGGDHSLKFGAGWRRAPIMSFSHYSGGARAWVQCVGNDSTKCGDGQRVPLGSPAGIVPYRAVMNRDQLRNNDWWTYFGYIQNEYSRGRIRLKGGLRYDWQHSKHLGGCVPANMFIPDLLPSQCEEATQVDALNGKKIQPFGNWSPRLGATYDLFGNGKTSIHGSGSYYYDTKITLANSLTGLFTTTTLTWGPNASSGACSTTAGASCWNDANMDMKVQLNELIGNPTSNNARFNQATGVFAPAGNIVDPSTKIGRVREGIVGVSHELIPNLALGVDYIYRKYDRGLANYTIGYQPGAPGYPLSQIYTGPLSYTDPITNNTGEYYVVRADAMRPSGVGSITMTDPNYQIYNGVDFTVTKRYSDKWQFTGAVTIQDNPQHFPEGSVDAINPTGIIYRNGVSTLAKYVIKLAGSYDLPWGITAAGNFNMFQGATRTLLINGPGNVPGGVNAAGAATTISYTTLEFQDRNEFRFEDTKMLDLGVQKEFAIGPKYKLKVMADLFNVFNINEVLSYSSNNISTGPSTAPSSIIPPRVLRLGVRMNF